MREKWSGNHPASDQTDFPGVDQWEAMDSTVDVHQSIQR